MVANETNENIYTVGRIPMKSDQKIAGIRFIVTSACNYDCTYCHNEWEPKNGTVHVAEKELIDSLVSASKILGGDEVDLTGGEPLMRMDRVKMILESAQKYKLRTNITTNGYYLAQNLEDLASRGLTELHVHVPSLRSDRYVEIMRGNANLSRVISAIDSAKRKIPNVPIANGKNEDEIKDFILYFGERGVIPRFIESMPTLDYLPFGKEGIDSLVHCSNLEGVKRTGSYLWGINTYEVRGLKFETLRCICFDRKCDICQDTNFIHVDQDMNIRPCNLRAERYKTSPEDAKAGLMRAFDILQAHTDVPAEYQKIWNPVSPNDAGLEV
jgi:MoaA/NifB/PqqE/SkfB family radical SAM enzyme